jgi:hypothetical protein
MWCRLFRPCGVPPSRPRLPGPTALAGADRTCDAVPAAPCGHVHYFPIASAHAQSRPGSRGYRIRQTYGIKLVPCAWHPPLSGTVRGASRRHALCGRKLLITRGWRADLRLRVLKRRACAPPGRAGPAPMIHSFRWQCSLVLVIFNQRVTIWFAQITKLMHLKCAGSDLVKAESRRRLLWRSPPGGGPQYWLRAVVHAGRRAVEPGTARNADCGAR